MILFSYMVLYIVLVEMWKEESKCVLRNGILALYEGV
jgi:hypothetical protein